MVSNFTIYKFDRRRLVFNFFSYFVKVIWFNKGMQHYGIFSDLSEDSWLISAKEFRSPREIFVRRRELYCIEITRRIPCGRTLDEEEVADFFNQFRYIQTCQLGCHETIKWEQMLSLEALSCINSNEKISDFLRSNLGHKNYPQTGLHGDFKPENVLIDSENKYWVIDWENSSNFGSFFWDLCWFKAVWKRNVSKAPYDVRYLANLDSETLEFNIEELLVYSLMKFRADLRLHRRSLDRAWRDCEKRIEEIMCLNAFMC